MSNNLYKDYYKALARDDEWSLVDAEEIQKKIEMLEDSDYEIKVYPEEPWDPVNN